MREGSVPLPNPKKEYREEELTLIPGVRGEPFTDSEGIRVLDGDGGGPVPDPGESRRTDPHGRSRGLSLIVPSSSTADSSTLRFSAERSYTSFSPIKTHPALLQSIL